MTLALARKWRPRSFAQLLGQDHINRALSNSLNQQRLHHAYLFTGTRGVGKTSIARLMAKALNCEQGISATPCCLCNSCLSIEQGSFLDLIEIDAASKTRVEDTREILENVQYAPINGRYKVYLIDEVHMLSQHSFNALLKTLEEPPAHVIFLLATTDPQKLPVTVLSRCLQFHLKPIAIELIEQQLEIILNDEGIEFEVPALRILASAARGSMRDALSLLDQTIAYCAEKITVEELKAILGYSRQDYALQLLQALAKRSPQQLIDISRLIASEAGNYNYVLNELLSHLHQLSLSQHLNLEETSLEFNPELLKLGSEISAEDSQLFYQIGIQGLEALHLAPSAAIGFEMTILRMFAFQPAPRVARPERHQTVLIPAARGNEAERKIDSPLSVSRGLSAGSNDAARIFDPSDKPRDAGTEGNDKQPLAIRVEEPVLEKTTAGSSTLQKKEPVCEWAGMIQELKLSGLSRSAAENAEWVAKQGNTLSLRISKSHQSLFAAPVIARIEEALSEFYKEAIKLDLQLEAATQESPAQKKQEALQQDTIFAQEALENDRVFKQLKEEFSAEMVKNSVSRVQDDL